MAENIHKGHRARLKERAAKEELRTFSPHQIVELLLFFGIPRRDVSELAHALVQRFGSLNGVLSASLEELKSVKGVGDKAASLLYSVGCLTDRYAEMQTEDRIVLVGTAQAMEFALKWARNRPAQIFQICLSKAGVVLSCPKLCDGANWSEPEQLRRALREVVGVCAQGAILVQICANAHEAYRRINMRALHDYSNTLSAVDAQLMDYILVDDCVAISMAQKGAIEKVCAVKENAML